MTVLVGNAIHSLFTVMPVHLQSISYCTAHCSLLLLCLHFASLLFFFFPNLIIHRCFFACCCCFFPAGAAIPLVKISCIAKYF